MRLKVAEEGLERLRDSSRNTHIRSKGGDESGALGGDSVANAPDPPLADLTHDALMLALDLRNTLDGDDR